MTFAMLCASERFYFGHLNVMYAAGTRLEDCTGKVGPPVSVSDLKTIPIHLSLVGVSGMLCCIGFFHILSMNKQPVRLRSLKSFATMDRSPDIESTTRTEASRDFCLNIENVLILIVTLFSYSKLARSHTIINHSRFSRM